MRLMAQAGDSTDASNYLGMAVRPRALEVASPPPFGEAVELDFQGTSGSERLAAAFRAPSARGAEWAFTVRAPGAGEVVVSAPDLSAVPAEYGLVLTDVEAGRSVDLRTAPVYRYRSSGEGVVRHFALAARPRTSQLAVTGLSAAPARGGGAELRFVLTADAAVEVTVLNIAGRPVRTLERSRVRAAGQQVLRWDGRNDAGLPAPTGRYLVRVKAAAANGASAQALSATSVSR
jgi:hypothetical protein